MGGFQEGGFWPHPQYGWDFPEEFQISLESTAGIPQNPIIQCIWGFQSISRSLSPPVRLGTPLFSEVVPVRASQSQSVFLRGFPNS